MSSQNQRPNHGNKPQVHQPQRNKNGIRLISSRPAPKKVKHNHAPKKRHAPQVEPVVVTDHNGLIEHGCTLCRKTVFKATEDGSVRVGHESNYVRNWGRFQCPCGHKSTAIRFELPKKQRKAHGQKKVAA